MSAAKHTALAAASFALIVALALSGAAAGARDHHRHDDRAPRDHTPPSAPTNLRAAAATPTTVALAWNASTDNVAVAGYYLYVDQKRVKVAGTSYTAYGLQCGQSVDVWIVAYDTSNNRSLSTRATVSTAACPDVLAPTPPTGFVQQATTQTGAVLAWKASSDNTGVVGYDLFRNLALVSRTAQPTATVGGLSCGSAYQYQVDAYDAAGNHSSRSPVWVQTAACGDSQPPTAPSDLTVAAHTTTSLSFSWTGSTDNIGVAGYRVTVNGAATTTGNTNTTVASLGCGTTYSVSVVAFDAAGNSSNAATTRAATDACPTPTAPPDTTPPSQPTGLKLLSSTQTSVDVAWSPSSDDVGVTGYGIYVNGASRGSSTETGATLSGLTCGTSYTFAVDAYDAAGNRSTRASLTGSTASCIVPAGDTTPPSAPGNLVVSSATQTSVSLGWSPSTDDVGVTGYGVYRNGTSVSNVTQPGATVSGLACGTAYTFSVDAVDSAGNRSAKAQVTSSTTACADSQAPSPPANVAATSRTATSIALGWSASTDNVGVTGYGLYKNGSQVGTVSGTTGIFSGLACNTNYTLAVDAYDADGNRSGKSTVMVATTACPDSTPPSTPTGLAAANVSQTSVGLSWAASTDNVAVTGYDVYRNGTKMATVAGTSSSQSGLACGTSYTFGVVAFDAAGNRSQQAQLTVSTSACSPASPPPATGTVFYVDPNGSDSTGDGSQSKPWKTIDKACGSASSGTISIAAGTYVESGTCNLKDGVSMDGAGTSTIWRVAKGVPVALSIQNTTKPQTVSDLELDGQAKTTADFGIQVRNSSSLSLEHLTVIGFRGPGDRAGGGIDVNGATDLDIGYSTLSNNASDSLGSSFCSGDLGVGNLVRAKIHDLTITSPQGYGVKSTGGTIADSDFYNLRVQALSSSCSSWNTLAFELQGTDVTNTQLRNSTFNRTVSLTDDTSGRLSSGYRWRVHNNDFETAGDSYALELNFNSSQVDHNYFKGGYAYPIADFTTQQKAGNTIDHNVVDIGAGPTAFVHIVGGVSGWKVFKNTIVMRQSSWRDGVFSLAEGGVTNSTLSIADNIFYSTYSLGDKLGLGLGSATIDHDNFWNLSSDGTNAMSTNPQLPLSGGFPGAYVPASGSAASNLGAFADGGWTVGPS